MSGVQFIVFIRGLPGAGKSTISNKICNITGYVRIDPDLIPDKYNISLHKERMRKYKICLNEAIKSIRNGLSIVWAQPWRKIKNIQLTINRINNLNVKPILVNINIPVEESWNRSKNRFYNNRQDFDNYISKFAVFDNNFKIDSVDIEGTEDINTNVDRITKFLRNNVPDE
ncbi:ATP-binding protein [Patescibacteria group bacterium]|nr:ATP-binding protein [Patescibacteria group bacterium]MBU1952920.1 ATP-binding protein [Patescibacteria group bacterium]